MKRILIVIVVLVGVGGLIALLSYHPKKAEVGTSASTPRPAVSDGSPSPAAVATYKDGTYTGQTSDTVYGPVQVQAVVSGGKITVVNFLQLPNDQQESRDVSAQAKPLLLQEALQAQSAQVDVVSGATQTSEGFVKSLGSALGQAKA